MKASLFILLISVIASTYAFNLRPSIKSVRNVPLTSSRRLQPLKMGLFDGIKKMVGVMDATEALAQENEKVGFILY